MLIIQVCVGSSCHLKGSAELVSLLQEAIAANHFEDDVTLCGSFCLGQCNRVGVTVSVGDAIHTGINRENFREFFKNTVIPAIEQDRRS